MNTPRFSADVQLQAPHRFGPISIEVVIVLEAVVEMARRFTVLGIMVRPLDTGLITPTVAIGIKIQRGEFYLAQVTTRDGGNRQAADSTTAPNAGFQTFTGNVNQNNADFYFNADWHGNAGDAAYMSFYRDNDCRSARLYRHNIGWNGTGESRTAWNQRNVDGDCPWLQLLC